MGIVFDIQKFSLHDGPGIRTTVFLKGCPLSCVWCANPESQSLQPQLAFVAKNCQHCMACVETCPTNAHQQKDGRHVLIFELCRQCGECVSVCPHNALKMYGRDVSVDEVIAAVEKDRIYYEKSGGGMTLSGGEPTYQFEFAKALLVAARARNIHTCLETAGHVAPEKLQQLLPLVDCFLFDFKILDDNLMLTYAGVSSDVIQRNLHMLNEHNASIILRCPIIPGINDTTAHFTDITKLAKKLKNIRSVHILPYHNFGRSKAAEIGRPYHIKENAVDEPTLTRWLDQLVGLGCPNVQLG